MSVANLTLFQLFPEKTRYRRAAGKETLHIVLQTGAEIKKIINSRAGLQYKLCHLIYGA